MAAGFAYRHEDYLELVDWRGRVADEVPPIPNRLGTEPAHWLYLTQHYVSGYKSLVGGAYELREAASQVEILAM